MNARKKFTGFATRTGFTPIPNPFFSAILPYIKDLSELKVTLHIFWALYRMKGYPKFVTFSEMRGDEALMLSIKENESAEERLRDGLKASVSRGTLLRLEIEKDGESEDLYFLNNEAGQMAKAQIESGEVRLSGMAKIEPAPTEEKPNVFTLYEQHIGLLTPMIAEELKEAEELYPASWIEDAFRESARLNKRKWRYVSTILERWASEGETYGRTRKNPKADIDPEEFLRKYGHLAGE